MYAHCFLFYVQEGRVDYGNDVWIAPMKRVYLILFSVERLILRNGHLAANYKRDCP